MKRTVKLLLLVSLVVVLLGSIASAKFVEEWVGSDLQMQHYLATRCEALDFQTWCMRNGYLAPVTIGGFEPSMIYVNESKGESDLGTLDITNEFDRVNVKYLKDLNPVSIGVMIEVEGSVITIFNENSLEEVKEEIKYNIAPYLSGSDEYCNYMATFILYDLGVFMDTTIQ